MTPTSRTDGRPLAAPPDPDREERARRRFLRLRWLLLATAVLQLAAPVLVGFDAAPSRDPVVVPPSAWFAVWGPITLSCLAVGLLGVFPSRAADKTYRQVQVPLSSVQLGFVAWLVAADRAPALTVPVFSLMLLLLLWCLRVVADPPGVRGERATAGRADPGRAVLRLTVGLYTGWTSAAVWVNTATVLPGLDPDAQDLRTQLTLAALLAGAVGTLALGLRLGQGQLAYAAAGLWALAGVTVSTAAAGAWLLLGVAVTGGLAVAGTTFATRTRSAREDTDRATCTTRTTISSSP